MAALECGAIANRDEVRRVGHYWLRTPERAPSVEIRAEIEGAVQSITSFVDAVHHGEIHGAGGRFEHAVHIGIGGSALGPQLVCDALPGSANGLAVHFLDNADPSGIDLLMAHLRDGLGRTLVSVVSKSGWTPTPHHVMLEVEAAYQRCGLDFSRHAVAITMAGTDLDRRAQEQRWLARSGCSRRPSRASTPARCSAGPRPWTR
jgi:glucose-6-phosphate isomerase